MLRMGRSAGVIRVGVRQNPTDVGVRIAQMTLTRGPGFAYTCMIVGSFFSLRRIWNYEGLVGQ